MPAIVLAAAGYIAASLVPGWRSWLGLAALCIAGVLWTFASAGGGGGSSQLFLAAALLPVWIGGVAGLGFRAISLLMAGTSTARRAMISGVGLILTAGVAWWVFLNL